MNKIKELLQRLVDLLRTDPKTDILWRVYLVYSIIVVVGLLIVGKIIYIQVKEGDELLKMAEEREIRFRKEMAHRGNVVSKNGTLLATSVPVYSIYFDPMAVKEELFKKDVDKLADSLSRMLKDKSRSQYASYLKKMRSQGRRYVKIANKVTMDKYKRMCDFPIFREGKYRGGFIVERTYVRTLPYGELAARTIGYTLENEADSIYVGLEGAYDDYLKGTEGVQLVRRINNNFWMPIPDPGNADPVNGDDIYTSIDIEIQDVAENALERCLAENKAMQGCVIMMDVKSGFVEVMASLRYNEKKSKYEESYNFALRHNVEPGSTFKAVTMLTLLENDPNLSIDDKLHLGTKDFKMFYGRKLQDSHLVTDENGYTTIRNAFEQSSNIAFATLVDETFKSDPDRFIDLIYSTKINEPLNLDIQGAANPYIKNTKDKFWSKLSLPWMSIGYEVLLTPMQILTYYNAIANDGVMVKPQFVKEIRHNNEVVKTFDTIVINESIASPRTIANLQELLKGVVENGTAKNLKKLGFSVAGKTGTAQISQGGAYNKKNYTATFVGYFPADEPKYSCIIVISDPSAGRYYGSSVSAPVFKELSEKVYATRLGLINEEEEYQADCKSFTKPSMVSYDDFVNYCTQEDISFVDDVDTAEWVKVNITDDVTHVNKVDIDENKVPDVKGMNVTDAVCLLESMGWKVTFGGYGKVKTQSVKPNTELKKGRVINLTLSAK